MWTEGSRTTHWGAFRACAPPTLACAALQVIAFFVFGTLLLLRKTVAETGITYSFGIFHMSTLWLAALMLQSGCSLNSARNQMKDWRRFPLYSWGSGDTSLVWATFIFACEAHSSREQ
jgi:EamA domain-containing membrane protein RarD